MKRILELSKFGGCGIGKLEQYINKIIPTGTYGKVSSDTLNEIFLFKGIPLMPIDGYDYYVYYNYHSSSGYKTDIYIDDSGEIAVKVNPPKGMVMCAFWNEIIIFTVTDRW